MALKFWWPFTGPLGVISHQIEVFIVTTVRISNPTGIVFIGLNDYDYRDMRNVSVKKI
jgi:hypothetical protein